MPSSMNLKSNVVSILRRNIISRPRRGNLSSETVETIVVAGLFSTGSGVGQSARSCYRALKSQGIDCIALDLSAKFNQEDLKTDIPTVKCVPPGREGTIILHLNGPETEMGLYHAGLTFGRRWRVIGYWAWELLKPPQEWATATQYLSEIWTPSEFTKKGIEPIVDIPIKVVPHFISANHISSSTNSPKSTLDKSPLRFLTIADGLSSFHRKNLVGTVQAYTNAFEESDDNQLVIKCRNLEKFDGVNRSLRNSVSERNDIQLIDQTLSETDMWRLLNASDVVLSLHRSEGFGLHLAEAMALGKVAVGTNWSGNLSFMTPNNSVLVSSELVDLEDPMGVYNNCEGAKWAEASISHAVEKLRELSEDAALRQSLGAQAAKDLGQLSSATQYVDALNGAGSNGYLEGQIPAFAE